MSVIVLLLVGAFVGWVASIVMRTEVRQGILLDVVVGIVGSLLGGLLLSPLVGGATINQGDMSVVGLLVSLAGAVLLLIIVNLFRRKPAR